MISSKLNLLSEKSYRILEINLTNFMFRLQALFKNTYNTKFQWFSSENVIVSSNEKFEIDNDERGSSLLIKRVDEHDQHEYKLLVDNGVEKMTFSTYLFVEGK